MYTLYLQSTAQIRNSSAARACRQVRSHCRLARVPARNPLNSPDSVVRRDLVSGATTGRTGGFGDIVDAALERPQAPRQVGQFEVLARDDAVQALDEIILEASRFRLREPRLRVCRQSIIHPRRYPRHSPRRGHLAAPHSTRWPSTMNRRSARRLFALPAPRRRRRVGERRVETVDRRLIM
jgi:hypothetical protein